MKEQVLRMPQGINKAGGGGGGGGGVKGVKIGDGNFSGRGKTVSGLLQQETVLNVALNVRINVPLVLVLLRLSKRYLCIRCSPHDGTFGASIRRTKGAYCRLR